MMEFYMNTKRDLVQSETRDFTLNKANLKCVRCELALLSQETILKGMSVGKQWPTFNEILPSLQQINNP